MISHHGAKRLRERHISINDVFSAISNGEIIEQYPNDEPFPGCLILGQAVNEVYIHVVISICDDTINLVTAYYPTLDKWEDDLMTRREL